MATFRPNANKNICELNFDDKFKYNLVINEDTAEKMAKIAEKQIEALKNINGDSGEVFKKAYNISLDALDELLGENAGAEIMSLYENPGLFEVAEVVNYINEEYSKAYEETLNKYKASGTVPPAVVKNSARGRK